MRQGLFVALVFYEGHEVGEKGQDFGFNECVRDLEYV